MDTWTLIRVAHVLALAFSVGGQLLLVAAVVPASELREGWLPPSVVASNGGAQDRARGS